jgi:iron(III) transport system permease protein
VAKLTQASSIRLRPRLDARVGAVWAILLVMAVIVLYPVLLLAINTFVTTPVYETAEYGLDNWSFAFTDRGMLISLWNTVRVAVVVHAVSLTVAIIFAWLIARTDLPGANGLELFCWFAFFMPTIAMVQGWILLWDPSVGVMNKALMWLPFIDESPMNIFSYWGIVFTHIFTHAIAIKLMLLTPAFKNRRCIS